MDRLEQLRQVIDDIIRQDRDPVDSRCGFVHLYGVSAICALLALRRGLDPEICTAAGMLHDIWNYQVGDSPDHAALSAVEAQKILAAQGSFSPAEIEAICYAISRHSNKEAIDGEMAELLKDADVFQHYLYHPGMFEASAPRSAWESSPTTPVRLQRLERVFKELGLAL